MNNRREPRPGAAVALLAGALFRAAITAGIVVAARLAASHRSNDDGNASVPIQPAIDPQMPSQVPHHFTENLLVPGFTETGQQVEEEDDTQGRSPEGV